MGVESTLNIIFHNNRDKHETLENGSNSGDLPVDVTRQLCDAGAIPCPRLEDMLADLANRYS